MKKNNLLPILLVAGAGFAAYFYFKNKKSAKEIADGVNMEPIENKTTSEDQSTTTSEEPETNSGRLIKTASTIYKGAKQLIKGRKRRKSRVIVEPTESSSTPFPETATTRKSRRLAKRTERRTARATKRTTRKETRTARRSAKKNKVVTGFEF
jgi:type IV secretory pathway VirB10-like protein